MNKEIIKKLLKENFTLDLKFLNFDLETLMTKQVELYFDLAIYNIREIFKSLIIVFDISENIKTPAKIRL